MGQTDKKVDYNNEIRIRGVGKQTQEQINNIADNIGITTNQFLKGKLGEIINSYPEKMRAPKKQD